MLSKVLRYELNMENFHWKYPKQFMDFSIEVHEVKCLDTTSEKHLHQIVINTHPTQISTSDTYKTVFTVKAGERCKVVSSTQGEQFQAQMSKWHR